MQFGPGSRLIQSRTCACYLTVAVGCCVSARRDLLGGARARGSPWVAVTDAPGLGAFLCAGPGRRHHRYKCLMRPSAHSLSLPELRAGQLSACNHAAFSGSAQHTTSIKRSRANSIMMAWPGHRLLPCPLANRRQRHSSAVSFRFGSTLWSA